MSRRLALFGAGGHGKVVADAALLSGWTSIDFFDDAWPLQTSNGHWFVSGSFETLLNNHAQFDGVLVSIGDCAIRHEALKRLQQSNAKIASVIHPAAVVSSFATLGEGSVVMAGAIVNAYARIGSAAIINTAATIDHDCLLGDAVHVCPGANLAGNVAVGNESWVGIGAIVKQGVVIGSRATVGAGAVVIHSVANGITVVGNPARTIQHRHTK